MKIAFAMVALFAIWPFGSSKQYPMTAASAVPAARGTVIKVEHLARPASLTPSANAYLVWIRPNGGDAFKQGAIGVDSNLNGELKTETVSKDFDVFITAEQSNSVNSPSDVEVLSAHVSGR